MKSKTLSGMLNFPQYKAMNLMRVIRKLSDLERITRVLDGEYDFPFAKVKLYSRGNITIIRNLIMKLEGSEKVNLNINNQGAGLIMSNGDSMEYRNLVISPNCTMELTIGPENWIPELDYPDIRCFITITFEGPLEVLDE